MRDELVEEKYVLFEYINNDLHRKGNWYDIVSVFSMLISPQRPDPIADKIEQDILRISINDDGTFNIVDFTLPSSEGRIKKNIAQKDVPQWVIESVSMLRISDDNEKVAELGIKIHDKLYYIKERKHD